MFKDYEYQRTIYVTRHDKRDQVGRIWKSFISSAKKGEKTLFSRKNNTKKIRLPTLISATLKIDLKFKYREKVLQK